MTEVVYDLPDFGLEKIPQKIVKPVVDIRHPMIFKGFHEEFIKIVCIATGVLDEPAGVLPEFEYFTAVQGAICQVRFSEAIRGGCVSICSGKVQGGDLSGYWIPACFR